MSIKLNRRRFMTSTLAVSAAALGSTGTFAAIGTEPTEHAIVAILKQRLPHLTLDEASLQSYVADVLQRLSASRNRNGAAYAGIFKGEPSSAQMEHFFVQDFLVRSNVFSIGQRAEPVVFHSVS